MPDPTLFGVSKSEWELINSFSNWISAVGTVAAAVVALVLARRAGSPRAKASVGHRLIIEAGQQSEPPEYVIFRLVNSGDRTIRITTIGWRVGLWSKREAMQMFDREQSSPLPVDLQNGQEASWLVPLAARDEGWVAKFARLMLRPHTRLACFTLRAMFVTSVGYVFWVKPERSLLRKLRAAALELGRSGG